LPTKIQFAAEGGCVHIEAHGTVIVEVVSCLLVWGSSVGCGCSSMTLRTWVWLGCVSQQRRTPRRSHLTFLYPGKVLFIRSRSLLLSHIHKCINQVFRSSEPICAFRNWEQGQEEAIKYSYTTHTDKTRIIHTTTGDVNPFCLQEPRV
jgi:hypothetical protein